MDSEDGSTPCCIPFSKHENTICYSKEGIEIEVLRSGPLSNLFNHLKQTLFAEEWSIIMQVLDAVAATTALFFHSSDKLDMTGKVILLFIAC